MKPESKRPWYSWAPNMPWPAILGLALLFDLNLLAGVAQAIPNLHWWEIHKLCGHPEFWPTLEKEHFAAHFFPRYAGIVAALQLNTEVPVMILSLKRNWVKNQESEARGHAQGHAQGKSEGHAEANAAARAWFEAHKDQLPANLPAPPFLDDRKNGS